MGKHEKLDPFIRNLIFYQRNFHSLENVHVTERIGDFLFVIMFVPIEKFYQDRAPDISSDSFPTKKFFYIRVIKT